MPDLSRQARPAANYGAWLQTTTADARRSAVVRPDLDVFAVAAEGICRPILIAIDDYQWADPLSHFALRALAGRMVGLPVV
jgi:hypothetical protein